MAITYHAGRRIQGSSAVESQTTVGTTFNLRFDFEVDSYPSGTGASGSYGLWSKDNTSGANTGGQDFVQLYNNDGIKHKLWVGKNTMAYGGSSTAIGGSWIDLVVGTQYYVEIVGNGDDTYTLNIRTSSHGGSHVSGSPQTVNASSLSSLADMKYFGFKNTTGGGNGGTVTKIDSLEIYNGTTSASGSADITDAFSSDGQWTFTTSAVDITGGVLETTMNRSANDSATRTLLAYTDEKTTITNVQVGSRFEETDTRKMYNSTPTSVDTEDVYDEITGRTDVSSYITRESPNHSNGEGRYLGLEINNNAGGQALVGKGVKKIKVRLYRGTALTGTYRVGIMDSSGTVKGFSDHDASEVTGSSATYSHTMNNAVILAVGDIIFISYTATTNQLYLRTNNITNGFGSNYSGAFSPRSVTTGTTWVTSLDGDASRLWMFDFDFAPATDQSVPLTWQEIGA